VNIYGSSASLSDYYRWHAGIYDWTRWTFLFGRTRLIRLASERVHPRRILEIGCGTGKNLVQLARAFPMAEIVGMDLSGEMLDKTRRKTLRYGSRVSLFQGAYRDEPLSIGDPFDLIVFSYCLSMINPGYADVLQRCQRDLSPSGWLAIVDFHDTPFHWFGQWMGLNHVRLDGQILGALRQSGLRLGHCDLRPAYGGVWRVLTCLASR
jgi:S-adenosylmethionine-diacylgycerolhomoserine-N-methlytransferase